MNIISRSVLFWLAALSLVIGVALPTLVRAEVQDVGIVTFLNGKVTFTSHGSTGAKDLTNFSRVRTGDRITIPEGGALRVNYLTAGKQESWKGPSAFVVNANGGEGLSGAKAVVTPLPVLLSQPIGRIPELLQSTRMGGQTVRSYSAKNGSNPISKEEAERMFTAATENYNRMRKEFADSDITPELYLFSVMQDIGKFSELKPIAEEMLRRQPTDPEVQKLVVWASDQGK